MRYFLLFILSALYFAIYSYLLDLVFYQLDGRAHIVNYGIDYFLYYILPYAVFTLPFNFVYNSVVEYFASVYQNPLWRYLIAISLGLIIGWAIGRSIISHYIGDYRSLKTIITFVLLLVSVEITRGIGYFKPAFLRAREEN